MTEPAVNVAADQSFVGVQAAVVHGDVNTHIVPPGATAEQRFDAGVEFLDSEAPARAWELISGAVEDGYVTDRSCFYWLLALVSGRTRKELSADEAGLLRNRRTRLRLRGGDEWANGVETVHRLLDAAERRDTDVRVLLKELDDAGGTQSRLIVRHLAMFLEGPLRDALWTRDVARARAERVGGERASRVWKFFQPTPCPPRGRPVRPVSHAPGTWPRVIGGTVGLAAGALCMAFVLVQTRHAAVFGVYALSLAAGYFGARGGIEWRVREQRRLAKNAEFTAPARSRTGDWQDGFAGGVDREVDRYFGRYVPDDTDRVVWTEESRGLRNGLRDELVDGFRESRVTVDQIAWLIRHRVGDIKARWSDGTLWQYQFDLDTSWRAKAAVVLGITFLASGGIWSAITALLSEPIGAALSMALMLAGGWFAVQGLLSLRLEERRYADETSESRATLAGDREAYERWLAKLADRPEDREMAAWLDCDRKVLLDTMLRHYRLSMSDVRAYAFIEGPDSPTGRARVKGGPWRYMAYGLRVFVLTTDGVRELEVGLDFETGKTEEQQRTNFRYEAVAAVRVRRDGVRRTLELALLDGQKIEVRVIGAEVMEEIQPEERSEEVSAVTLDAAGLPHTLHVLEGIAAEGKGWFDGEDERGRDSA